MGKVSCEACKQKCKKEAVRLDDKYYHVKCFQCKECGKQLSTDGFYAHGGAHYCAQDYARLFGTKCAACGQPATGEVISVLGSTYHPQCFSCSVCARKFAPGEKVTFGPNNAGHWCGACALKQGAKDPPAPLPQPPRSVSPPAVAAHSPAGDKEAELVGLMDQSGLSASPGSAGEQNKSLLKNGSSEGVERSTSNGTGTGTERTSTVEDNGRTVIKTQPAGKKVFGLPDNKFYNISYLERTSTDFKRGAPLTNTSSATESLPSRHYHRPDNFSYNKLRKDFKPDRPEYVLKQDLLHQSKKPDATERELNAHLAPIERDDWPGPPEPAAAYPELLREKPVRRKSAGGVSDVVDGRSSSLHAAPAEGGSSAEGSGESRAGEPHGVEGRQSRGVEELTRLEADSSGAAAVILRDLRRQRASSPTLDPRNASRTPSAAQEPMSRTRYETPYFKSPSRDLDMLSTSHRRSQSAENGVLSERGGGARSADITRSALITPRPGYTQRPVTAMDIHRNSYHDGVEDVDYSARPQSSAGFLYSTSLQHSDSRGTADEEFDPTTGLRHSHSSYLRAATLPVGLSAPSSYLDSRLTPIPRGGADNVLKVYTYEELTGEGAKQLPGVDRDALERHLAPAEFDKVFQMSKDDFYRQPAWKRTDIKTRVRLI